jgi:Ca2+-binding RTX toxin-like protein
VLSGDDGANELSAGSGGADRLSGRGGPDTLIGGPGHDALDGGTGADQLLSFGNTHGAVDALTCGAGEDEAQAARADSVATDCEHVYFGGTPLPRLTIAGGDRVRARRGVVRFSVSARPAEDGPRGTPGAAPTGPAITATASLRAQRGIPSGVLARARMAPFAAPGGAALTLRLSRLGTRALARRGTIRMRVEIGARDIEGNASITRRIVVVRR